MKQSHEGIIAILILAASAGSLFAQPFTFDENGNGIAYAGLFSTTPLPYQIAPDPTGGISTSPVLIYSLEVPVFSGDVALLAPAGSPVHIDALLRFFTPAGSSTSDMIFYSVPNGTLAGVGIPSPVNPVEITETGSQTFFAPGSAQPGEGNGTFPVFDVFQYTFITSPEPSPAVLLLVGTVAGLTVWRFRRKAHCVR